MKLLPSLQARQFSAATGLSRLLIILGAMEPPLTGGNVSEEVIQRQVGENTHANAEFGATPTARQRDRSDADVYLRSSSLTLVFNKEDEKKRP